MAARKKTRRSANLQRRTRPLATFTLSPEAVRLLEMLAAHYGLSKSATVEFLIRQDARGEGLAIRTTKKRPTK